MRSFMRQKGEMKMSQVEKMINLLGIKTRNENLECRDFGDVMHDLLKIWNMLNVD